MNDVYNFLDSLNIKSNEVLVVGVSYGPDSMFLLDLLSNYFKDNKIICAHVHHNHRKESDEEAKRLEMYCKENKITFEYMKIKEYKNNKFTEEEARNKRYEFFDKLMNKYNAKYLFTAHHGDDLTETVLMRIVRGSSIGGYSAISLTSKRNDYCLVRPLLFLSKELIINGCEKKHIPYAVDASNLSDEQTRNRYRNNLLKFLKRENENVHLKFLSFSKKLREYDDYVTNVAKGVYHTCISNNEIDVKKIKNQDSFLIKKIIELYLKANYKDEIKDITDTHVEVIFKMVMSKKSNVINSMPKQKRIVKSYNKIYFEESKIYNDYCFVLDDYVSLPNGYTIKRMNKKENNSNYTAVFNSKDISLPLYVRNKLDGDKIEILNLKGSKKVKDIFIDQKVNISDRKNYPVVVDSIGNILWIPGLKKSKYDKSKEGNYDIILKYCKEEKENESK